jgi:cyclophilin family peptidyl-prolyl cis-trans isomerase
MEQLTQRYPEDLQFVYRHFPLNQIHDKAATAAQAAEAAGLQGKFWEMHDVIMETQAEWAGLDVPQFKEWLAERVDEQGLDVEQFRQDLDSQPIVTKVQAAWEHASGIGLPGTPFIVINGQIWPDNVPLNLTNLSTLIDLTLLEKRQFTACPPMALDPTKEYIAHIVTEKGEIVVELFADKAPLAVNNFIFLAQNGWYDNITFHRVISGFMAQAGDPTGTGFGGPGYAFKNEVVPELNFDRAGILAMANAGPDSNGSQFFITYGPVPHLNGGYTIFGQVIEGMEVANQITPRNPGENATLPPGDKIVTVTIQVK